MIRILPPNNPLFKFLFVLTFHLSILTAFSQNKKEQILQLSQTIDSLKLDIHFKSQWINKLETKNERSQKQIDSLKSIVLSLQSQLSDFSKELEIERRKRSDQERNVIDMQRKNDSLTQIVFDHEHIVIGNQTWRNTNLNTTRFSNGDPIAEAKTPKEWVAYCNSNTPCYAVLPNNEFLYNGFVLRDKRGIAPIGYAVPSNNDFITLFQFILNGNKKWSTVQELLLDYDWYIEAFDEENGGGIKDSLGVGENRLGFSIRKAGFIDPPGGIHGYELSSESTEDYVINPNTPYKTSFQFASCSYFWTSTQTMENDEMARYESNEKWTGKPLHNGIDFGFCSQDEGGAIQDDQIQFIEYAPDYGFSIRLIKR